MDFINTNSSVIAFYQEFHKTFSRIDADFNKLDELGGSDLNTAKRIIDQLHNYHCTVPSDPQFTKDHIDCFADINLWLEEGCNLNSCVSAAKKLQRILHEFLAYNPQLLNHPDWDTIISKIIGILSDIHTISESEENSFYAVVRILRELVADRALSIRGLCPLAKWTYGTIDYSQLNANNQLVALINQAILTDRMYYCQQSLEIVLNHLNKVIDGFDKLHWNVYYTVGFLNFKIHQYSHAIRYFERVLEHGDLKDSHNPIARESYFHANLLKAYCYEYDLKFSLALNVIATDPLKIVTLLGQQENVLLDTDFTRIMNEICELAAENPTSLMSQYLPSYSAFEQSAQELSADNSLLLNMQFEVLHAFAHCLNEYSIDNHASKPAQSPYNYGICIRFARLIMKKIALFRPEYWTCYATIHGECKDYHIALAELDNAQKNLSRNNQVIAKESLVAEISFFRYYFKMLCNKTSTNDKMVFEQYAEKFDDDDAKCHLKIFEFRDNLRKYLSALYECMDALVDDMPFTESSVLPIPDDLQNKYSELCCLEPTLYMNASVRAELRLMQRAYDCIDYLRAYFIHPTPKNLLVLQNACYRFNALKEEFYQVSPADQKQSPNVCDFFPASLPTIVKKVFAAGKTSILSSLYSTDSIFILAPISGVVVFQYQTGTIQNLFDSTTILPTTSDAEYSTEYIDAIANSILEIYNDVSETIGLREMSNVNWDSLSKFADIIYHWSNKTPTQVVVCENEKASYVRQIVDEVTFAEVISNAKKQHDADMSRRYCKDINMKKKNKTLKCTLQKTMLPWLEIVNEGISCPFYIAWNDNIEHFHGQDTIECFIIPFKSDLHKHVLHTNIRNISILYQQVGDIPSESEVQEIKKTTLPQTEVPSELIATADQVCRIAKAKRVELKYKCNDFQTQLNAYDEHSNNPNISPIKEALTKCNSHISDLDRIIKYTEENSSELSLEKLQQCQLHMQTLT